MGLVLVAFLATLLGSLVAVQPAWAEWTALGLIIVAGIPHGAFDLRVAEAAWLPRLPRAVVAGVYVAIGTAMSAFCLAWPGFGLALFLLISAIHFSEGEGEGSSKVTAVVFGAGAILFPIGLHVREAAPYLSFFWDAQSVADSREIILWTAILLFAAAILLVARDVVSGNRQQATERAVCLLAWLVLPPLSGFCVWFVGRHSRQHLAHCKGLFSGSTMGLPRDFVVISFLAILLLAPLALRFDLSDINQLFAASIVLIAGLTLPHMVVSHRLKSSLSQMSQETERR